MQPLHELLSRIRWDPEFGRGRFMLGYFDRVENRLIFVDLHDVHIEPGDHFSFTVLGEDGETHTVPFHRVKQVLKDGELIWHREH